VVKIEELGEKLVPVPLCPPQIPQKLDWSGTRGLKPNVNLLKPATWCTSRFNIQQLYALHKLYLCVSYLSENKQRLVLLTA